MTMSRPIGAVSIVGAIREREDGLSECMAGLAGNASGLRRYWNTLDAMTPLRAGQPGGNTGTGISKIC